MNTNHTNRALLILLFLLSIGIQAQNAVNDVSKAAGLKIEKIAGALLKQANIPGLSIAISKNGNLIYSQGFGYANVKDEILMETDTQLRTASVAKVITATALGRLVSQNKLNLDAPIKKYIPYVNDAYANITSRQLAGHTSGLAHRPKGNSYKSKQYNSIKETVQLMKAPLLFEPDLDYHYSTHAFNLLAAVIEGISGKNYIEYMQEEIFKPLDMVHTFPENINNLTIKDAQLYYIKNNKLRKERLTNGSYKIPGASFRSTPTDLVKMMNAYDTKFISKDAIAILFKSHQLKNGEKTNVGIAWRSSIDPFGYNAIEHAGSWLGARTVIVHYPQEHLSISLMINASCQLLIEETAHMLAQVIRNSKEKNSALTLKNQNVELIFNSQKGTKLFKGTFSFNKNEGLLKTTNGGFLKSNPIFYLGSKGDYTLVTSYGLLYLRVSNKEYLDGKLYTYFTRQSSNPKEEKPLVEFKSIN